MASCFGDDDTEVTYPNETGITAFSLGTQKIVKDTVGKSGKDSTYQTTIDCSGYIFYIDQINHEIYNPDSLPVGIDSAKIICEATSKSSATILIKSMNSDTLKVFSSSDSISFYKPRTFRVLSLSGLGTVDYTVKVNIHREKPNVFKWQLANNSPAVADMTAMRAVALNGRVYVMGRDIDSPRIYVTDEGNTVQWHEVSPNIDLGTDFYKNIAVMGGRFYTYAKDGAVYTSADAATWTRVAEVSLGRILGASDKMLYALGADRSLMASADGATWQQQDMDTPADSLPTDNYSIMVRKLLTNQKINRVVLAGTAAYTSQVWSRIEETDSHSEPQPWTYMDVAGNNRFCLPNMENLQVRRLYAGLRRPGDGQKPRGGLQRTLRQHRRRLDVAHQHAVQPARELQLGERQVCLHPRQPELSVGHRQQRRCMARPTEPAGLEDRRYLFWRINAHCDEKSPACHVAPVVGAEPESPARR